MAGDFKMKGSRWENVSEEGKQLVANLLKVRFSFCVLSDFGLLFALAYLLWTRTV